LHERLDAVAKEPLPERLRERRDEELRQTANPERRGTNNS
jgi:hypothetical protein